MSKRSEIMANTDYNPYENRKREGQTTRLEALIHLLKGIVGTGILALPEAFKHGGYVLGIVGFIIILFLVGLALHLLFESFLYFCKRDQVPFVNFPDAFRESLLMGPYCFKIFASFAPFIINFFIIVCQLGILCIYQIFAASNFKQFVDTYTEEKYHFSIEIYMSIQLLPLLLITYIRNLKILAPVSNVANWCIIVALIAMHYFFFQDMPPLSSRDMVGPISTIPLFMGTVCFAVLSIGPMLSIELNMEDGKHFISTFGVINVGLFISAFLYLSTGFFGYWKYGDESEGSVTLNLDDTHPLAQFIRLCYALAICLSFPLNAYPIHEILWEQYIIQHLETSQHLLLWEYVLRTVTVLLSFALACGIPRLGLFISLIGAFCMGSIGLVFPPIMDICTRWPDELGKAKIILIRDILLILFGVIIWFLGTATSIKEIVVSFQD